MRKALILITVLAAVAGAVSPAPAAICSFDDAPAATLLFPYVVFDYDDPDGATTTLVSLTNVGPEAQVVHVTLWSDLGAPVLDFNLLLTGYDVATFNVRDILENGRVPVTVAEQHSAHEGATQTGPMRSASPLDVPQPTTALGDRCTPDMPSYPGIYSQPIPQSFLDLFELWLTAGQRLMPASGGCTTDTMSYVDPWWFADRTFEPTRFYITADVAATCGARFPDDPSYWMSAADGGQAQYDNVLTGSVYWLTPSGATSASAVHLEADRDLGRVTPQLEDGRATSFYARYSADGDDSREPLPTAWALHYTGADSTSADWSSSRILAWKGSTRLTNPPDLGLLGSPLEPDGLTVSNCAGYSVWSWDEEENVLGSYICDWHGCHGERDDYNVLPFTVQSVAIDQLPTVDDSGWLLVVWPPSSDPESWGDAVPDGYQTWMAVMDEYQGSPVFSPGVVMANANCFPDQVMPQLGVDYDYVDWRGYRSGPRPTPAHGDTPATR
jgi:hypothetical protein